MAVGKNKGLKIGGKKGSKKKVIDPFTRKEWYVLQLIHSHKVYLHEMHLYCIHDEIILFNKNVVFYS